MKFSCDRSALANALLNIQHAVSSKSSLPVLEGILIRTSEDQLLLFSYDLEIGMTTRIPASVQETGEIVLNAKLFTEIVRRMSSDQIEISADSKLLTVIQSGSSEFTILGIPASEFPEMPTLSESEKTTLPQQELQSMIRQTIYAISADDSRSVIYMGSKFEFDGGRLHIISLDGDRLAIRSEQIGGDISLSFIVPGKTLSELLRLLNAESEDPVGISVGKRHILFDLNGYTIISRLLEGDFFDYTNVIGKNATTETRISVRSFLESVERASLLISEKIKTPLRCVFGTDSVRVICNSSVGKAFDEIPASLTGEPVEIGLNNRYLLEALRACECDEIRVFLSGPLSPVRICPPEGDGFLFLVLPVRLKND